MEEIKVGEYVRIDNDFRIICIGIGKVVRISADGKEVYVDMCTNSLPISFKKEQIIKHSKNIIDLIEARDVIKYSPRGLENCVCFGIAKEGKDPRTLKKKLRIEHYSLEQINILEILTHEQYNANCYRLEA